MTQRIAIVGAGSFGARHLQGLARLERALAVDVVDPSQEARQRAAALLAEAGGLRNGACVMHADLSTLEVVPDLAIVATASRERPAAVKALVARGVSRLVLEKVLFTRLSDYDEIAALFARKGVQAWVNCARRAYPRAHDLVRLVDRRPVRYCVSGSGWGMASNVVHHLDEFAMLCGQAAFDVSADALEACPARRPGYVEFFGMLTASAPDGSRFTAACHAGSEAIPGDRAITIETDAVRVSLRQAGDRMEVEQEGEIRSERYSAPLQSELTAPIVAAILDGGLPRLPDFATAATVHRSLIGALLRHQRQTTGNPNLDECPIT